MAETGKKAAEGSAQPTNNPAPDIARTNSTPETPEESRNASLLVKCAWPNAEFVVEDVPVITRAGTMLTKTQLAKAEKAAGPSGVTLVVEEVN